MSDWEQVSLSIWEEASGERAAIALFRPTAREAPFDQLGFEYPEDEDGIGFAVVRLASGIIVSLIDDPGNPVTGTVLFRVGETDDQSLVSNFRSEFNLDSTEVKWMIGWPMKH